MPSHDSREIKRLLKELADIKSQSSDPKAQVTATMTDHDLTRWRGQIRGPEGTPYEGGKFNLQIEIPPDYPYTAPEIKFITKIWHPNISSQTGAICLDILKNEWSPALTIRTALLSIQALLSSPEPDDPQDAEVAAMYLSDKPLFDHVAKMWTEMFASDTDKSKETVIQKLMDMGFDRIQCETALGKHDWNEHLALNSLLDQ